MSLESTNFVKKFLKAEIRHSAVMRHPCKTYGDLGRYQKSVAKAKN